MIHEVCLMFVNKSGGKKDHLINWTIIIFDGLDGHIEDPETCLSSL